MSRGTDFLYIEDNEDYIEFVKRAMTRVKSDLSYDIVTDGKGTLQYIDTKQIPGEMPRLILLDINLPDVNGIDLLNRIRSNKSTRYTPVVMLSSSENSTDIRKAMDAGANAYLVKPVGLGPLTEQLQSVFSFWLTHHQRGECFAA